MINKLVGGANFQETISVNEGESTARGLELEATYLASENLRLTVSWTLDHEYDSFAPLINRGTFVTGALHLV